MYKILSGNPQFVGRIGELVSMNIQGYYNILIDDVIHDFWPNQLEWVSSPINDGDKAA
jgi:hypothetical protein